MLLSIKIPFTLHKGTSLKENTGSRDHDDYKQTLDWLIMNKISDHMPYAFCRFSVDI